MHDRIPIRLRKEPLIEVVWEIRFTSAGRHIADLLPGMAFKSLSDRYPKVIRLPNADIPVPVVEEDPRLRYAPKIRLEGGNQAVQIGEHVVSLSCRRPYPGWKLFSEDVRRLINVVRDTGLIEHLERFSLKYIDLIDLGQPPSLTCLNTVVRIGQYEVATYPVQLRTEIREGELSHIVQIASPVEALISDGSEKVRGVLLDIDTIRVLGQDESWSDVERLLDEVHLASKRMFFGLLKPETIRQLDPEYEE